MKKIWIVLLAGLLISLGACRPTEGDISPEDAALITEEAYIFAFPMLETYKMIYMQAVDERSPVYEAPLNTIKNRSVLLGPEYTAIVRPNNDTFYSVAGLDLRGQPMVLSVPAITDGRYYSFQLIDLYSHNYGYIGTRATGFEAGDYLLAGPGWEGELPEGIEKLIRSEGNLVVALGRTQVSGTADVEAAKAVQMGFKLRPLHEFLGQEAPEAPAPLDFPEYTAEMANSMGFVVYLNFILGQLQPHPGEAALMEKFSKIGIGPDRPFDPENIGPVIKEAMEKGIASAREKIEAKTSELGELKNGWMQTSDIFGTRDMMQGKYLVRAAAAQFGLWGNTLEEAFYPATSQDAGGEALDGSKANYVLHFEADALPPVKAFWSLSMYKLPEQHFIENEIDR